MIAKVLGTALGCCIALSAMSANAFVVFSDNFDDGDASDWIKTTNYVGTTTSVADNGASVSPQHSLYVHLQASGGHGPGGVDLVVWTSKDFNAPVTGDYTLSVQALSTVCSGCTVSYDIYVDYGATAGTRVHHTAGFQLETMALPGLSAGSHAITLGMHTTNASSGLFGARFDDVTVTLDRVVPLPGAAVGGVTAMGVLAAAATWRRRAG